MDKLNLNKDNLRKFGITIGTAFLIITLFILIKHKHSILPTSIISAIFFILAVVMPVLLKPVYIFWMKLAFILAWINTRLILFAIFYLVFAPVGIVMKLCKVDLLDRKIGKDKKSYWKEKEKKTFSYLDYQRQF